MKKRLNRLQWYSSIIASILAFIVYLFTAYAFTKVDLLEMLCVSLPSAHPERKKPVFKTGE